jgi:hypothetical protein
LTDPATAPAAQQKPILCFRCNKPGTKRCSTCSDARYCSTDCQKQDRKLHKLICKSFANLPERTNPKHFQAILFSYDEVSPRFVWLKQDGEKYWHFDREDIIGKCRTRALDFDGYKPLRRRLDHGIAIWYSDDFLVDGSLINESLRATLSPRIAPQWRDRFLALQIRRNREQA